MKTQEFILAMLPHSKAEGVTDAVALGAVTSPLWLHDIAGVAKDALPILGGVWLVVQIGVKLYTTFWKKH